MSSAKEDPVLAIIGGSGFYHFPEIKNTKEVGVDTPYGAVNGITFGELCGRSIVFLPRHGKTHKVPPHKINYRAIMWALSSLSCEHVVSINAVGGIAPDASPGTCVVPDQVIDYTYNREHTFADELNDQFGHIDFTWPFASDLREHLIPLLRAQGIPCVPKGVYGCCQGPRLETAAEIVRIRRDGCDLVGMTAMPEAALAAELKLNYAAVCPVVNWAAGISDEPISLAEIEQNLLVLIPKLRDVLQQLVIQLA